MDTAFIPIIVSAVSALVALGLVIGHLARVGRDTSRITELEDERRRFADRLGLAYVAGDTRGIADLPLQLFRTFSPEGVHRVASGMHEGRRVRIFDLDVAGSWSGMDRGIGFWRHHCALVETGVRRPTTVIDPVDRLDRLMGVRRASLGLGDRRFDRRYRLSCEDPPWLTRVLDADLRAWLLRKAPDVRFEIADDLVVASRPWVDRPSLTKYPGMIPYWLGVRPTTPPLEEVKSFLSLLDTRDLGIAGGSGRSAAT
ncbi:MAG TPA: hypothetical protein VMN58_06810 [Acidimicrobiales bacterium]|nr:hypothetical protein [Acidimicrobiales bacterium]